MKTEAQIAHDALLYSTKAINKTTIPRTANLYSHTPMNQPNPGGNHGMNNVHPAKPHAVSQNRWAATMDMDGNFHRMDSENHSEPRDATANGPDEEDLIFEADFNDDGVNFNN